MTPTARSQQTFGVLGRGRLASALVEVLGSRLAWQAGRSEPLPGPPESAQSPVVIDASLPEAVEQHLEWAVQEDHDLVIAVTGWTLPHALESRESWPIGVVLAPNGSLTIALFARLARVLGAYAHSVPEAGAFLLDHHHGGKQDAPSGTALRLLESWRAGAGSDLEPSVAALRTGHEIGLHVLGLDSPDETFELRHRARDRRLFARGLITAANWVRGRRGLFTMDDVATEILDPLFIAATGDSTPERTPADCPSPELQANLNSKAARQNAAPWSQTMTWTTHRTTPPDVTSEAGDTPDPAIEPPFRGLWVALATPFAPDGELDLTALQRLVRHCAAGGVQGLLALGSTGEAATLTEAERDRVISTCLEFADGLPVLVGTGSNATRQAVRQTRRAQALGADGALVVTPWYNKPNPSGLDAHYAAIHEATDLPLVVYNVPGRTGQNLRPDALARLWELPSVVAIKESSGDLAQIDAMVRAAPEGRVVLVGDDGFALPAIALGAAGLVSVVANVLPSRTRALVESALGDRFELARIHHAHLAPMIEALFIESNPVPLKAALSLLGLAEDRVRAPLATASPATRQHLEQLLNDLAEVAA